MKTICQKFGSMVFILTILTLSPLVHASKVAYILNFIASNYTQCLVDGETGIESSTCQDINLAPGVLNGPTGIAFDSLHAYIINLNNNSYTQCNLNDDNIIESESCKMFFPATDAAFNAPSSIIIDGEYAYITNFNDSSYTRCEIDMNGIETGTGACVNITPLLSNGYNTAFSGPTGMAFQ
ncbi:MAG: hypothetical protein QG673_1302 [Pseudomonadota bacterium]|nr:hypothetical protein [Pseudomonadota bacterium]